MVHAQNPTVLVTGGSGLVGGEVILALARRGQHVRAVVRGASEAAASERLFVRLRKSLAYRASMDRLVSVVAGDTSTPRFGLNAPQLADVTCIIHCAANTQFAEREDEQIWSTNVGGARHLVELARAWAPSARVVFVSTAAVVTAPEGHIVDEHVPYAGYSNMYTRSKREAEGIVTASGLDVVIVRPSIVLSRGVADRTLARSILWAVPIMSELGEVPVEPDAHIDFVPVDYVAEAIARVALKPTLSQRLLHISAGDGAETFLALLAAIVRDHPAFARIRPVGRHGPTSRRRARLMKPMQNYLPFINMDVRYATDRLVQELDWCDGPPPAHSYVPDLVGLINLDEALEEMYRP